MERLEDPVRLAHRDPPAAGILLGLHEPSGVEMRTGHRRLWQALDLYRRKGSLVGLKIAEARLAG